MQEPTPSQVPSEDPVVVPSTLTAAPADGVETGVFPRLLGSGVPGATVDVTVRNEAGFTQEATTTVDADGEWQFTPSNTRGVLTITAVQRYERNGTSYVEESTELGEFAVGDGLRISVTEIHPRMSRITVTGFGAPSKNQVVNIDSSTLGSLVSKLDETSPGQAELIVMSAEDALGDLTYWQGDTSVGPQRIWRLVAPSS
ncbi:hypothetical protein JOF28_002448 [Leucobacter exalbidus]|uniref:Bacterial Ig domain-containing protein n=1 Tax=Leucobacter exalbidus TaxID=662960 RepID=A0A940PY48_9MICO|nr:hypothetical protein [Leucobacter exalbidus]MBP1327216.1 hypothetical protein [Leucobacter exalbidus]